MVYNRKKLVRLGDAKMPKYIKAAKAIELSGLPVSTFHRWVAQGRITKHFVTNESSRAVYDEDEIKKLREEQGERTTLVVTDTDWMTGEDLGSLFDLEYKIYGEDTGDPRIVRTWLKRNPYIGRILFNKADRRDLWGAFLVLPIVDEPTMIKLVTRDGLRDITLDPNTQIRIYEETGLYDLYVASVIMKPGKEYLLTDLIKSYFNWWVDQAPSMKIGKIWGRVVSGEGELLAIRLQASPLDWLSGKVYRLDLSIPRRLPLVRDFQQRIKAKENEESS